MADEQQVLVFGALAQQLLELGKGGVGRERCGGEDGRFVAHLGADEGSGLQAALERAGDNEIEGDLHRVEHMRKLEALCLAVLVERTLAVEDGIGAADAGAGVAQDVKIHKL